MSISIDGSGSITGVSTLTSAVEVPNISVGAGGTVITTTAGGNIGINSTSPERRLDVVDSGASGSVIRSRVTTNNGGYLAYEALNSSGTSVFSVTHNGRINLSENLVFASGQGIDFSATSDGSGTTTSELLDDYEEGTWTPIYRSGSTGGTAATLTVSTGLIYGNYVKIGNIVHLNFGFTLATVSGSLGTALHITNIPFSPNFAGGSSYRQMGTPIQYINIFDTSYPVYLFMQSDHFVPLVQMNTDWTTIGMNNGSSYFHASISYLIE